MKLLKILGYLVGAIVVVIGLVLFGSRFTDGPTEVLAGGPFTSGEHSAAPEDWSFLKDYVTVEFQLVDPPRSRTTWIAEHNNRVFIPSGYMNTTFGKIWKHWPMQAEEDGRAILRVDNRLINVELHRVKQDPDMDTVLSELSRKYLGGVPIDDAARAEVTSNNLWIFELKPR